MNEIYTFALLTTLASTLRPTYGTSCPRDRCRVVRNTVFDLMVPLYQKANLKFPPQCPFNPDHDIYGEQENLKQMDGPSHWMCNICGKAFYTEKTLDQHFDNRHPEQIKKGPTSVCLADYCDIFRCDIIMGIKKPDYWSMVMCKHEEMKNKHTKCKESLKKCVPPDLSSIQNREFYNKLTDAICSKLDCDKYWDTPPEEGGIGLFLYILAGFILVLALIIYYFVAYSHFYSDEPIFAQHVVEDHRAPVYPPGSQEIRNRFQQTRIKQHNSSRPIMNSNKTGDQAHLRQSMG
ncbi:unnamed protein product [Owenia fusiformis]|uniref:C2H2-type domain-containing protein n=1 Tax=Owenia fusiformis TaxID=6347 RepID=A0A8S4NG10_OWEFU|nr:unnamed protein product [Owenia fusiformis]